MTELGAFVCSVCIANYNGGDYLMDCIESVLDQDIDAPIEIIIHDDASSDRSLELLQSRYASNQFPHIVVLESKENVGYCMANNRMVKVARSEFILLLNNDAALAPDAIKSLWRAAKQQSRQGILSLTQYDWITGEAVDRGCFLDPFYNPVPNLDKDKKDVGIVIGACLWIPRKLWLELGGFPEWFQSIGEDVMLCCQARLWGYPVQIVDQSHYRHRQGRSFGGNRVVDNGLSTTYRRRRLSERNKTFVLIICSPIVRLCLTLPIHLVLLTIEGIILTTVRRDPRIWYEIYGNVFSALIRNSDNIFTKRAEVQSNRAIKTNVYSKIFLRAPHKLKLLFKHGLPQIK